MTPASLKVSFGQSPGVMRRERQADLVPANVDVGMMVGLLRCFGDPVHKGDRGREIGKGDSALDVGSGELPDRQ